MTQDKGGVKMYITVNEAASRLSVSKKTIYRRIADGSIKVARLSPKSIRIDSEDFERFLDGAKARKPYTRNRIV